MGAAIQGNAALVSALLERGANPDLTDNHGRTAFHLALARAYADPEFAAARLGKVYPLLAPASTSVKVRDRLVKIDAHTIEFFLFHSMAALLLRKMGDGYWFVDGYSTADFLDAVQSFPENVSPCYRKRRGYLSGVLARNEVDRDYPYNRRIFLRLRQGYYVLNPQLAVRVGEEWVGLYEHLGQRLIEAHGLPAMHEYFERIGHVMARREGMALPEPEPTEPPEPSPDPPKVIHQAQGRSAQLDLFDERD
jgi:hypothetical protein